MGLPFTVYYYNNEFGPQTCGSCLQDITPTEKVVKHPNGGEYHPVHLNCQKAWMFAQSTQNKTCLGCNCTVDPNSLIPLKERISRKINTSFNYIKSYIKPLAILEIVTMIKWQGARKAIQENALNAIKYNYENIPGKTQNYFGTFEVPVSIDHSPSIAEGTRFFDEHIALCKKYTAEKGHCSFLSTIFRDSPFKPQEVPSLATDFFDNIIPSIITSTVVHRLANITVGEVFREHRLGISARYLNIAASMLKLTSIGLSILGGISRAFFQSEYLNALNKEGGYYLDREIFWGDHIQSFFFLYFAYLANGIADECIKQMQDLEEEEELVVQHID